MKFIIAILVLVAQALVGAAKADTAPFTVSWAGPTNCTDGSTTCLPHITTTRIYWQEGPVPLPGQVIGTLNIPMPRLVETIYLPATNMCFKLYFVMDDAQESAASTVVCKDKTPPPPDTDADGVIDSLDNCKLKANASQCDSDGDGYGNICDGDLNNSGATSALDTALFRQQIGMPSDPPAYNEADFNCNGFVNAFDTTIIRSLLGSPPGPSGLKP